jgi:hypothetical protein
MKESLLFDEERKRKEAMDNSDWLLNHTFLMEVLEGWRAISDTTIPRIQQFMPKKRRLATQSPGTKVDCPRNSSKYPCCSHRACKDGQSWDTQLERVYSYLSNNPKGKSGNPKFRLTHQRRSRKVKWQKHHIPQKVLFPPLVSKAQSKSPAIDKTYLTRAHLIKRDKRKRLRQHGTSQILFCQQQRNGNHRKEKLREESQRFDT